MGEAEGALAAWLNGKHMCLFTGGSVAGGEAAVSWLTDVYARDATPAVMVRFTCFDYSGASGRKQTKTRQPERPPSASGSACCGCWPTSKWPFTLRLILPVCLPVFKRRLNKTASVRTKLVKRFLFGVPVVQQTILHVFMFEAFFFPTSRPMFDFQLQSHFVSLTTSSLFGV